jgi:hypothetical protein
MRELLEVLGSRRVARWQAGGSGYYDLGSPSWMPTTQATWTLLLLLRARGATTAGHRIWTMENAGTATHVGWNGTAGQVRCVINRATTDTNYNTGSNTLVPTSGEWTWMLITVNSGAGAAAKIGFARRLWARGAPETIAATVSNEGSGAVAHQLPIALGSPAAGATANVDVAAYALWTGAQLTAAQTKQLLALGDLEILGALATRGNAFRAVLPATHVLRQVHFPGTEWTGGGINPVDGTRYTIGSAVGYAVGVAPPIPWQRARDQAFGGLVSTFPDWLVRRPRLVPPRPDPAAIVRRVA